MGANEKHAATYHGVEYTPTPDEARATWVLAMSYSKSRIEPLMQSFDRMIAKVRAEAKAEAWAEGHAAGEGSVKAKDNPYKETP